MIWLVMDNTYDMRLFWIWKHWFWRRCLIWLLELRNRKLGTEKTVCKHDANYIEQMLMYNYTIISEIYFQSWMSAYPVVFPMPVKVPWRYDRYLHIIERQSQYYIYLRSTTMAYRMYISYIKQVKNGHLLGKIQRLFSQIIADWLHEILDHITNNYFSEQINYHSLSPLLCTKLSLRETLFSLVPCSPLPSFSKLPSILVWPLGTKTTTKVSYGKISRVVSWTVVKKMKKTMNKFLLTFELYHFSSLYF